MQEFVWGISYKKHQTNPADTFMMELHLKKDINFGQGQAGL